MKVRGREKLSERLPMAPKVAGQGSVAAVADTMQIAQASAEGPRAREEPRVARRELRVHRRDQAGQLGERRRVGQLRVVGELRHDEPDGEGRGELVGEMTM